MPSAHIASLFQACEQGDLKRVKALLAKEPELADVEGASGRRPLWTAARHGHLPIVKLLAAHGASLETRCIESCSRAVPERPMIAARRAGHEMTYCWFLRQGCHEDIFTDAFNGYQWRLHMRLDAEPDQVNAIEDEHMEMTMAPLHWAIYGGHTPVVQLLLERGANPNFNCFTRPNNNGFGYPWTFATFLHRNLQAIDQLLGHGLDAALIERDDNTLMAAAQIDGDGELVALLKKHGHDAIRIRSLPNMHRAGALQRIERALDLGADVDLRDDKGRTCLHRAAKGNQADIARMLIDRGAAVDARDPQGDTPLIYALQSKRMEVVPILLQAGADASLYGESGRSAIDLAKQAKRTDLIEQLRAAGAR